MFPCFWSDISSKYRCFLVTQSIQVSVMFSLNSEYIFFSWQELVSSLFPCFFQTTYFSPLFLFPGPAPVKILTVVHCWIIENCELTSRFFPAGNFISKANTDDTRLICWICSKLTTKTLKRRCPGVLIDTFNTFNTST